LEVIGAYASGAIFVLIHFAIDIYSLSLAIRVKVFDGLQAGGVLKYVTNSHETILGSVIGVRLPTKKTPITLWPADQQNRRGPIKDVNANA